MDGGGQGIDAPGNPDRPVAPIIIMLKFYVPDKIKPARWNGVRITNKVV